MGGGPESCRVGRVYGLDGAWQKTMCCNLTSSAPDDGRMYQKHVELRRHQ